MRRRRVGLILAAVTMTASCSSGDPPPAAPPTVESLPPAEGRTVSVLSADTALIGGGAARAAGIRDDYTADHDLWLLDSDGGLAELPSLPTDLAVVNLSATQVGDVLVMAGLECATPNGGTIGSLSCMTPSRPAIWVAETPDRWTRHGLPEDVTDVVMPGTSIGNFVAVDLRVLGVHEGRVVIAFGNSTATMLVTFDPADAAIEVLGEGWGTAARREVAAPLCLDEHGAIFQVRRHLLMAPDSASGRVAEDVSVARLDVSGRWAEGRATRVADIATDDFVRAVDIECRHGALPLVTVSTSHSPPLLATVDAATLSLTTMEAATENLADRLVPRRASVRPDGAFAAVVGTAPDGDILLQARTGWGNLTELFRVDGDEITMVDALGLLERDAWVFVLGDQVGAVAHSSGEVWLSDPGVLGED